jgi:hypothetical protein
MGRVRLGKGATERWIVIPDAHVPYHDPAAWAVVKAAIATVRPDGFINLGDFIEGEAVSHWQWKKRSKPPLEYLLNDINEEITTCNDWFDDMDEALDRANVKKRIYIQGNHCEWYDHLVEEHPFLSNTSHDKGTGYLFKDAFKVLERGYEFIPAGLTKKIGKLHFYHGHLYGGIHHTRNHLLKMGVNVMYGHWHDIQEYSLTHVDGPKAAWSIGCLKSPEYNQGNQWLHRRPTNWAHGFAVVDFWDDGMFTVDVVRINNGKCALWGKLLTGKK